MHKRSISNKPIASGLLEVRKSHKNPSNFSNNRSIIDDLSSVGTSCAPKTLFSDNYDLTDQVMTPREAPARNISLPPKAKKMLVRKTKSSINPGVSHNSNFRRQSSNGTKSAHSWRNFTPISLNCPNSTTLNDYKISILIGQGAFGVVKRAQLRGSNLKVAIKQYDKSKLC